MNRIRRHLINLQKINAMPRQDLFIYYLKGRLKTASGMFQNNFLGNWQEEDDSFLFFSSPASGQVQNLLYHQRQLSYVDSYEMSYDQWLGETFGTFDHRIFRITPIWESGKGQSGDEKVEILLDPGLVFGTGTHPTTRDCLQALELAACSREIKTVLDLGTGTGLLSLAAARLGSRRVVAVDLNLLAAKTAVKNVKRNQLQDRVLVVQGNAEDVIDYPADLVIANIHYDVMRHLINAKGFVEKKRFILSGLLRSEANHIADRLARLPVQILKQWTRDGIWHTFYGGIEQ
ncbi:MAG: 50S ribosomal protein L11 methyltransferase [Desulfobacterales bacterium]|jgi:ribosomal protein L11 methyltransferase